MLGKPTDRKTAYMRIVERKAPKEENFLEYKLNIKI